MDTIDRRTFLKQTATAGLLAPLGLAGFGAASASAASAASTSSALALNPRAWHWDETNNVYWQIGNLYVTHPAAKAYETLGVYVPGKYFTASKNDDGLYTAKINPRGRVGKFTARTAVIAFPVNTPGYAAQQPPTSYSYSDVSDYIEAGFVYVAPGLRGRDSSTATRSDDAPWGVTDLKAAIRYVRLNEHHIPGDPEQVVVFGMSGGGAQSIIAGASGDSALYTPYLKSLGAAMHTSTGRAISDAVAGVMAWCPITSLDEANASYEWNMGQFASSGTRASGTWTAEYSRDLSTAWAAYQNKLALKDPSGTTLRLTKSSDGIYLSGTYYEHLISVITTSLNNFLRVTTFPYTPSSSGGMGGAGGGGTPPSGSGSGAPSGGGPSGTTGTTTTTTATTTSASTTSSSTTTTYETAADYIAALNSDGKWIDYDSSTKKAKVLTLKGFVNSQKTASKPAGAFDGVTRGQTENYVHGIDENPLHFSPVSRAVIAANQSKYAKFSDWESAESASAYESDFARRDTIGRATETRVNMYNPMYYLSSVYQGHRTAKVASDWRIRTGIMQGDTANTTEINLALALQNYGIKNVDFLTIWGEGHTEAELTGEPTSNFISWVEKKFA